jgi:hypothetical protein
MPGYDYLFNNTGPTGQNEIKTGPTGQNEIMPPNYGGPVGYGFPVDLQANLMAQGAGAFGSGSMTPGQIRQDAINWGQKAGLPNRISFAGERGRDILNPNEMRVNAPSVEHWKQKAQRKMMMDRMYEGEVNPYYGQDQDWGSSEGIGSLLEANVDPSDWRVIQQIMGAGGNPDDYIETAGLGSDIYNYLDDMLDFEGMKDQIPYMLDNFTPNWLYQVPEGYYDETDEWKEEIV